MPRSNLLKLQKPRSAWFNADKEIQDLEEKIFRQKKVLPECVILLRRKYGRGPTTTDQVYVAYKSFITSINVYEKNPQKEFPLIYRILCSAADG